MPSLNLPELVLLKDDHGDWNAYLARLYACFTGDFVVSKPHWPGKRVGLKRFPVEQNKEATFWHFISEGETEADRKVDLRRCERIRWPKPVMEAFPNTKPDDQSPILWWKSKRRTNERYVLALPDFSYVVVVDDRGDYVLPWTAYTVEKDHRREKLRREYDSYWSEY